MRKKLLNCALLTPMIAAPSFAEAQSNVTLYGIMDVTTRHASNAAAGRKNSLNDGAFTASRLGFKGKEDLGDGAAAIFSLEMGIDPSTGTLQQTTAANDFGQSGAPTGRAFGREALVGLSAPKYGTVTLGRQNTLAHQMSNHFQPMGNPNLDVLVVFSGHYISRQDNMVKYVNQFGPVSVGASYTVSEGNGRAWSAAASYVAGPIDLVSYVAKMKNATDTEERNIYSVGGNYALTSKLKGYLGYMLRSQEVSDRENRVWLAGMLYQFDGPYTLGGSYTRDSQNSFGTTESGRRSVASVTFDYLFSKRTDVYLELDQNQVTGGYSLPAFMATKGKQSGVMLALRHRF